MHLKHIFKKNLIVYRWEKQPYWLVCSKEILCIIPYVILKKHLTAAIRYWNKW